MKEAHTNNYSESEIAMAETQPPDDSGSFWKHPEVLRGSVTVLLLRKMPINGGRVHPKGDLTSRWVHMYLRAWVRLPKAKVIFTWAYIWLREVYCFNRVVRVS